MTELANLQATRAARAGSCHVQPTATTRTPHERYRAGRTVFAAVQQCLVTIGIDRCRDCPHSAGVIHRSGRIPGMVTPERGPGRDATATFESCVGRSG